MRDRIAQVLPELETAASGYASVLAMYAFALEYRRAEKIARRALVLDPRRSGAIGAKPWPRLGPKTSSVQNLLPQQNRMLWSVSQPGASYVGRAVCSIHRRFRQSQRRQSCRPAQTPMTSAGTRLCTKTTVPVNSTVSSRSLSSARALAPNRMTSIAMMARKRSGARGVRFISST